MAQYNDLSILDGLTKKVYGKGVHQAVPDNVHAFFDLSPSFLIRSASVTSSPSQSI